MLIKKIIARKTRNGIWAFLLGLVTSIGALYSDLIRGDMSGTIGLYQVVGALTGYLLSGIGVMLVMKADKLRKALQNSLLYGGAVILAVSLTADYIGIAGPAGFDKFQANGMIVAVLILIIGILIRPQIISQKLNSLKQEE